MLKNLNNVNAQKYIYPSLPPFDINKKAILLMKGKSTRQKKII